MKNKSNKAIPIVSIVLLLVILLTVLLVQRNKQSIYTNSTYKYSFNLTRNMRVDKVNDESVRVWESKNIAPAPSNSDMESPTKYVSISVDKFENNSSVENFALKDLPSNMLKNKSEFEFNGIKYSEFCFETSVSFCEVYAIEGDKIYQFKLRDNDSWKDSPFYQSVFSTFRFN